MLLTYGGIPLEIEHIARWDQRDDYSDDGTTYLFTHHRLSVRGVINLAAMARNKNPQGIGLTMPFSKPQIELLLSRPRQLLTVQVGDRFLLMSPAMKPAGVAPNLFYPTDCKNGPCPIGTPLVSLHGQKTAVVDFDIETWVNPTLSTTGSALLAHRWSMQHDIDENFFTTRTIQGHAVFRTDHLLDRGEVPDDFRQRLFHSVPPNFTRIRVSVQITEDGTRCNYTIVDRQNTINLDPSLGITKVEASMAIHFMDPGIGINFATRKATLSLHIWGSRRTKRIDLLNALTACANAYGFPPFAWFCSNTRQWVNMAEKEASLDVDILTNSMFTTITQWVRNEWRAAWNGQAWDSFPEDLTKLARFNNGDSLYPGVGTNHQGSRGDYIGRMVHQALTTPSFNPPPKPPAAEDDARIRDF